MPNGTPGDLQKFGAHAGSLVPVVLIGPTLVPVGDGAVIADFGATAGPASTDSVFELQKSNDGFVLNIVPMARIEMPSPGTVLKTWDSPPKVDGGSQFRVIASQGAAGPMSAELMGQTKNADITD
ncbi:MAG: hypothetical protein ACM31I_10255 [Deltaproteobacteria bacterium]